MRRRGGFYRQVWSAHQRAARRGAMWCERSKTAVANDCGSGASPPAAATITRPRFGLIDPPARALGCRSPAAFDAWMRLLRATENDAACRRS